MTEGRIPIDHSVRPSLRPEAFPFQMLTPRVYEYATTVARRSTACTGGAGETLSTSQCRNRRFSSRRAAVVLPVATGAGRGRQTNPQCGPKTVRVIRSDAWADARSNSPSLHPQLVDVLVARAGAQLAQAA